MKLQEKLKSAGENKLVSVQCGSWSLPSWAVQLVFDQCLYNGKLLKLDLSLDVLSVSHGLIHFISAVFSFNFFKVLFKEMHLEKL